MSQELFPHIASKKLSVTVAQQIRDTVRDMPPGMKLPSLATIAEQLGVGQSTVREALTGLAVMGIVEVRHGQGTFVADNVPPAQRADSLTPTAVEARTIVEVQLAGLAASRRTSDQVTEMATLLDKHEMHLAAGEGPIIETSRFHMSIIDAAHNEILAAVVRPFLEVAFQRGPALYQIDVAYADREMAEHRAIFDAIKDQQADTARSLMSEHLDTMNAYYLDTSTP